MSLLLAARCQMALSLIFHIVFAAIGIGMPALMVVAERRYLSTGQAHYLRLTKKWAKAVGLLFAIGAISGTALAFEIGLLWPRYMQVVGGVVGHLFGLEGFAFFIEAIFIGLYLYGWDLSFTKCPLALRRGYRGGGSDVGHPDSRREFMDAAAGRLPDVRRSNRHGRSAGGVQAIRLAGHGSAFDTVLLYGGFVCGGRYLCVRIPQG